MKCHTATLLYVSIRLDSTISASLLDTYAVLILTRPVVGANPGNSDFSVAVFATDRSALLSSFAQHPNRDHRYDYKERDAP
jgi:hypothetical protein